MSRDKETENVVTKTGNYDIGSIQFNLMLYFPQEVDVGNNISSICKLVRSKGKYVTYSSYIWTSFNKMLIEHYVTVLYRVTKIVIIYSNVDFKHCTI